MSLDSMTNRGEYLSAHYLAEILPGSLKGGVLKKWAEQDRLAARAHSDAEREAGSPRARLRALRRTYYTYRSELTELEPGKPKHTEKLRELHRHILAALSIPRPAEPGQPEVPPLPATPIEFTVRRAGGEHTVPLVHAEPGIVVIESGWATDADAAADTDGAARLLDPVTEGVDKPLHAAPDLASYLLLGDDAPRYVIILSGAVVTLADRLTWFEGRSLAVSLDVAFARNDTSNGGELDVIAALFGADSLRPPPEGGAELLATLRDGSRQHAVGVSGELREGLRLSVELIANEVLHRIREAGVTPEQIMEPAELGRELARESLRYLYRILFLLYAEARPELGVLPVDGDDYIAGYSLARLGETVSRKLIGESAERGFHLYESLDLLFRMVNEGHNPRGGVAVTKTTSEGEGIRFEPLKSDLFLPEKTRLIGRHAIVHPDYDEDDPDAPRIDTRLRNVCLHHVLRLLMIAKGKKKGRGGFISYAQLGINQLGAVYEGLMSYTGFIATEELYEVAKKGDPKDGSWMIPASKVDEYPREVFVERIDEETGVNNRVRYDKGSFVYRLAGRDRQTSASYYTPQSLTEVTVQLALKYRLEEEGRDVRARELLDWTICEPALGSGAFLNEAINQVAAEYLRRAQAERGETLDPERYAVELQKVKAYIALHNCYGVDLNRTAVELAEVSLWLNTMHPGLQAPWFGLHLRRGNSLIGCGRKTYTPSQLADKSWLKTAPEEHKLRDGDLPGGVIHHFLLPADGWGAVSGNSEAKALAPEHAKRLAAWRRGMHKTPVAKGGKHSQVRRLQELSGRVEYLWRLVRRRLEISEREIRRDIKVWGAEKLPEVPAEAVLRDKIVRDLESPGTPYWRLKTLMDAWCALWFWPLDRASLLDGSAPEYGSEAVVSEVVEEPVFEPVYAEQAALDFGFDEQLTLHTPGKKVGTRTRKQSVPLRKLVPLADLDDWIEFAESMLGRHDIPADSLIAQFETLDELEEFEDTIPALMGMDHEGLLADRFPWLTAATGIAEDQGFFHWELTFGHAFVSRGGFDLQVGNPPWVRPDWKENIVLAEHDPHFSFDERQSVGAWRERRGAVLAEERAYRAYLGELNANSGLVAFLGDTATFPQLVGTRPDLYRAFMCRVWGNLGMRSAAGLVHPDTHFGGAREGLLRADAYHHLRFHAHFHNRRGVFSEVHANTEFGIHIYGTPKEVGFAHVSWLFEPSTLTGSLIHDGTGDVPGIKRDGKWDLQPHAMRILYVEEGLLGQWARLVGDTECPVDQTRLLFPVSSLEQRAMNSLADVALRLRDLNPLTSLGFDEGKAKKDGVIVWDTGARAEWGDVILQGPHFGIATPISKEPSIPCRSNRDWTRHDPSGLTESFVPASNYRRASTEQRFLAEQDRWLGRRYTEYYRLAWRKMIAFDTERSLYASLIPPGPTHVDAVNTLALETPWATVLVAGFWSALPLDYILRVWGKGDVRMTEGRNLPGPQLDHPLAPALALRTLRLNCMTNAYAPLWMQLYAAACLASDNWAADWPGMRPLTDVNSGWERRTPLRTERERRAALVEIDALVSVWLEIECDELLAIYRSRYPILSDYDAQTWFDSGGRRIAGNHHTFGYGQTKEHYEQLMAYLEGPQHNPVPEGYTAPFYKADRENEYRQAHAVFSKRLQDAIDAGWSPS